MKGLMSPHPLTLVQAFSRAERLFADKTITTLTVTGREHTTYGDWALQLPLSSQSRRLLLYDIPGQ